VLRIWSKVDPKDSITTSSTYLQFAPTGTAADGTATNPFTFTLSPAGCSGDQSRVIKVKPMGRAESQRATCT
jgi:hypothetical protein